MGRDESNGRTRWSPMRVITLAAAFATDVRLGARSLVRSPGFTALGVLILGAGIAAASLSFTLIHAVLLEPLPYPQPEELYQVSLEHASAGGMYAGTVVPIAAFASWRDEGAGVARVIASDEARQPATMYLAGTTRPEVVRGAFVSTDWFDVLGVPMARGRGLGSEQAGSQVVVVAHSLWSRALGSDPAAVGSTIRVNGRPFTIIGVLPADFVAPPPVWQIESAEVIEVWAPMAPGGTPPVVRTPPVAATDHDRVLARVPSTVPRAEAAAELGRLAMAAAPQRSITGVRLEPLRDLVVGDSGTTLAMLAAIVGLTLLLTCANVAGIQLARFSRRRREAAIRAALGAMRTRVFAHFMAEGLVLAVGGGLVGLLLAVWLQDLLRALAPAGLRRLDHVTVNGAVATFTVAVTLLAGLVATVWPALATAAPGGEVVRGAPVTGTREQRRARDTLVVAQIVMAVALLAGTGALVRSMVNLRNVDIGVRRLDVLVVDLHRRTDDGGPVAADAFYAETLRRVRALPGVTAATLATSVPFRPRDYYSSDWRRRSVADGYFEVLGIPLIAGRTFDARDAAAGEPVAVISRSLAARQFEGEDPVGRMLDEHRVIGVVEDVRHESVDAPAEPAMYSALAQRPDARLSLIVRADLPAAALGNAVRAVITAVDPEQPVATVAMLRQFLDNSPAVSRRRFQLNVLVGVAAFAMLLAALGVYGVAAQAVVQRTPEIGVRITMGATRSDIFLLVLGGAARHILVGVALGTLAGIAFVRLLAAALFSVSPVDPLSLLLAATLLALTAFIATAMPARRAVRVDPAHALRQH